MFFDAPKGIQTIIRHAKFALCIKTVRQRNEFALPASHRRLAHWVTSALRFALTKYAHRLPIGTICANHTRDVPRKGCRPFSQHFLIWKILCSYLDFKSRTVKQEAGLHWSPPAAPLRIPLTTVLPQAAQFIEAMVMPYNGHPVPIVREGYVIF